MINGGEGGGRQKRFLQQGLGGGERDFDQILYDVNNE